MSLETLTPPAKKPKRKKPFNATSRAMKDLEWLGFRAWIVESKIPHTFISKDCFGFADILAHRPGVGVLLIQATSGGGSKGRSNMNARRAKLLSEKVAPDVAAWLASGGRVEIWNYERSKSAPPVLHRQEIKIDDLPALPAR